MCEGCRRSTPAGLCGCPCTETERLVEVGRGSVSLPHRIYSWFFWEPVPEPQVLLVRCGACNHTVSTPLPADPALRRSRKVDLAGVVAGGALIAVALYALERLVHPNPWDFALFGVLMLGGISVLFASVDQLVFGRSISDETAARHRYF